MQGFTRGFWPLKAFNYFANGITLAAAQAITWLTRSKITSPADGTLQVTNNAGNLGFRIWESSANVLHLGNYDGTGPAYLILGPNTANNLQLAWAANTLTVNQGGGSAASLAMAGSITSSANPVGGIGINSKTLKGGYTGITTASETLTFAADPGDATKTTASIIPAGCFLLGVTGRVLVTGTNATSFNVGDGTDADRFGAAIALAATTTFTSGSQATADPTGYQSAAKAITLTAVGANAFSLSVRITVHYINLVADTTA